MPLPTAITRVSVADDGGDTDAFSFGTSVSADGRFVAFDSLASNVTPDDTNGAFDVFVRDTAESTTARVSVADDGGQGNDNAEASDISADGRFVAFRSAADNLVPEDTNQTFDLFVRDLTAGTTTRVSVADDESQAEQTSFDAISAPSLSADGRYVAFASDATNLVPNDVDSEDGTSDVFVRDLAAGTTTLASLAANGAPVPAAVAGISADGRFVAFISDDGGVVAGDTNDGPDVFVRDTVAGTTTRVSVADDESQAERPGFISEADISADGRTIVFDSGAANLVPDGGGGGLFVRDVAAGTTTRVDVAADGGRANGFSSGPSLSADGRYVAFRSGADNLVPSDTNGGPDAFVRDLVEGTTRRVNLDADGDQAEETTAASASGPSLSADNRYVVFNSYADDLVPGDANANADVFITPLTDGIVPADTTVVAELRARSASFTDAFGWYDAATGRGQLLDPRASADADPSTADTTYGFTFDADRLDDLEFFIVPDGAFYLDRDGPALADDTPTAIEVTDDNRVRLVGVGLNGADLRGRLAPAFFTEDGRNPEGLDRADEVDLDGDASLPDLVFEDGRDDDRNDLAVSLRIEDVTATAAAAGMPPRDASVPDLIPTVDANPAG